MRAKALGSGVLPKARISSSGERPGVGAKAPGSGVLPRHMSVAAAVEKVLG